MVQGDLLGGPIEVPSLAPIVAMVAGVVLAIVALLLLLVRERERELPLAEVAVANAPLIVADAPTRSRSSGPRRAPRRRRPSSGGR